MKKQVIVCDRCGGETRYESTVVWRWKGQSVYSDLCEGCEEKLHTCLTELLPREECAQEVGR